MNKTEINSESSKETDNYAVVQYFETEPMKYHEDYSFFVTYGHVNDSLKLINCENIKCPCAVVPNIPCNNDVWEDDIDPLGSNTWFMVSNHTFWLEYFSKVYILQKL